MALPRPIDPKRNTGLSPASIYADARKAGFNRADAIVATAIALAESGGVAGAHNPKPPDDSYGLWQINMIGGLGPARRSEFGIASNADLYDPMKNAQAAYQVWKDAGGSFSPWTTYTGGSYRSHLSEASWGADTVGTQVDSFAVVGRGPAVVGNAIVGAASDAVGGIGGAISGAVDKLVAAAGAIGLKFVFVGLGVGLIGVGAYRAATGASRGGS